MSKSEIGERLAEVAYFNFHNHNTYGAMVKNLPLTDSHKKQIVNYIGSKKANQKITGIEVTYKSASIFIKEGNKKREISFSKIHKNILILDGKLVKMRPKSSFYDVIYRLKKADKVTSTSFLHRLLVPTADAENDNQWSLAGAIIYWTGIDQYAACTGGEIALATLCRFKSNETMIQVNLGDVTYTKFKCEGNQFKEIGYRSNGNVKYDKELTMEYDSSGSLAQIKTYQNGRQTCSYTIKDGVLESLVGNLGVDSYCHGRTTEDYMSQRHSLDRGDKLKEIATISVPIQRLQECCKQESCRDVFSKLAAEGSEALKGSFESKDNRIGR